MPEAMSFSAVQSRLVSNQGFDRLDPALTTLALRAIQAEFAESASPFERQRALCAQIGLATDVDWRRMLISVRDELEERDLAMSIATVHRACDHSPAAGWQAWLVELTEAVVRFRLRHAAGLCEPAFAFESAREAHAGDIRRAVRYMRQSRWEEAIDEIEQLARQKVSAAVRGRLLAMAAQIELWWRENVARARALLDKALELAPNECEVVATDGYYWLSERQTDKAQGLFQRAIELNPRKSNGYVGMGDRYEKDNQLEEAERWYREAMAKASGDSLGYEHLLSVYGRETELPDRSSDYRALMATRLAVDGDGTYDVYLSAGDHHAASNRVDEAQAFYDQAIALQPTWPRVYVSMAQMWVTRGDAAKAEQLGRRAIELDRDYPDGYSMLAKLYEQQSRWSDALAIYQAFPPGSRAWKSFARASVGRMYAAMDNPALAERTLIQALHADAKNKYAQGELEGLAAESYRKHRDMDSARRMMDALLQELGEGYRQTYHNLLGHMHYDADEWEAAVEQYRLAVAAAPDNPTYHRNLGSAYQYLGDYDQVRREFEAAFRIDRDEKVFQRKKASLANAMGNAAYRDGDYRRAVENYAQAAALDPTEAVYLTNQASAWEQITEPGQRGDALAQVMRCVEGAEAISPRPEYRRRIERLRRQLSLARDYGEQALGWSAMVTPIAVEVAADLIPLVKGDRTGMLSSALSDDVTAMRKQLGDRFGIAIPGLRFRGTENDMPAGTYVLMIHEVPAMSGHLSTRRRYVGAAPQALPLGVTGEPATDPLTGDDGAWVDEEHGPEVEPARIGLWRPTTWLMRQIESVLARRLFEFLGHQEVASLLRSECGLSSELIASASDMVIRLTSVCRALVAEQVPIRPFAPLFDAFKDMDAAGVAEREIVERLRSLPLLRDRLPGNDGQHRLLGLGPHFEKAVRRSLYEHGGRTVLAMEPQACQDALSAVRERAEGRQFALVVADAALRPFIRRLVELEFSDLHVLAQPELLHDASTVQSAAIELENEPPADTVDFRSPLHDAAPPPAERPTRECDGGDSATRPVRVEARVSTRFEAHSSQADDKPMPEMLSMMRDGLFRELGVVVPEVAVRADAGLEGGQFTIRIDAAEQAAPAPFGLDEFCVNETVDRLTLLGLRGRRAVNPANGQECAIVSDEPRHVERCRRAGLTTWGPKGFLVLSLAAALTRNAARLQTDALVAHGLDALAETFPDLVRIALERYPLHQIAEVQRALLREGLSIRDLRGVLEGLLSIDATTDVDESRFIVFPAYTDGLCLAPMARGTQELNAAQLADYVRTCLKRYVSYKFTRGRNTLLVYLLDPTLEQRLARHPLQPVAAREQQRLLAAVRDEVGGLPPSSSAPVILTTFSVRGIVRSLIQADFPNLAVLSYQELSPELNIQPMARIAWD